MSLAAETRRAVDANPFLHTALRAGVVNYSAAARFLAVAEDESAVVAALRRYEAELAPLETSDRRVRVTMQSGVSETDRGDDALLVVGDTTVGQTGGSDTALIVEGAVDAPFFTRALSLLEAAGIEVRAAGLSDTAAVLVVPGDRGARALQAVERASEGVPSANDDTA